MPRSLHNQLAFNTASRSPTPVSAPSAHAASYSGPSPAVFQFLGWVFTRYLSECSPSSQTRPQAIVQAKHALLVVIRVSLIVFPLRASASSNWPSWKLRVGKPPAAFVM